MPSLLLTRYQTQYTAWQLTCQAGDGSIESLASTLVDSQADLNPHQVDATLFACHNPLSRGVILADEVGLGKTIEAGLVISQHQAERRRKMLIIVPANLRKQWHQELQDKFSLQGLILDAERYSCRRLQNKADTRNLGYFEQEVQKLDDWADDLKHGLEQDIKETDREIKEVRRTAATAATLDEKLSWQKKQRELESKRNKQRCELFDRQDEIEQQRNELIAQLEESLQQQVEEKELF